MNEAGEAIIDPLTGEAKITVTYEPFIGQTWRDGPMKMSTGMTFTGADGSQAQISPIFNFYGPGYDQSRADIGNYIGDVLPGVMNAQPEDDLFDAMFSEASPATQPMSTKLWGISVVNSLDGRVNVWDDASLTNADTELETVDFSTITTPTYLLYGGSSKRCPTETNKYVLSQFNAKRELDYPDLTCTDFYKSDKSITRDVITILGSGAATMMATATALAIVSIF